MPVLVRPDAAKVAKLANLTLAWYLLSVGSFETFAGEWMVKLYGLVLSICSFIGLAACQSPQTPNNANIKMEIPLPDGQGNYVMQVVEVPRPTDMETLSSEFVDFAVKVNDVFQFHLDASGGIVRDGQKPSFRFVKRGDIYVPTGGMLALEAATAYYHMSKMYQLTKELGLELAQFWPRRVVFSNQLGKNQAFYVDASDVIGFAEYNHTAIPAAANAEVFAHEFFHALSYHLWARLWTGVTDENAVVAFHKNSYKFHARGEYDENRDPRLAVRAFGEGLSDVFALLVTGQSSVLANFLPEAQVLRKLSGKVPNRLTFERKDYDPKRHNYLLGTFYAESFLAVELEARKLQIQQIPLLDRSQQLSLIQSLLDFTTGPVYEKVYVARDKSVEAGVAALLAYAEQRTIKTEAGAEPETETNANSDTTAGGNTNTNSELNTDTNEDAITDSATDQPIRNGETPVEPLHVEDNASLQGVPNEAR